MRYSLSTFLLSTLFIATLMGLWFRREPWAMQGRPVLLNRVSTPNEKSSPDGTRVLRTTLWEASEFAFRMYDFRNFPESNLRLFEFTGTVMGGDAYFVDDDTVLICAEAQGEKTLFQTYRRRFPEWWWGHFFRPEAWAALLLFVALIVRARPGRKSSPRPIPLEGRCEPI